MDISNFIYRQKQKIKYHLSKESTEKLIAEINRYEERIEIKKQGYFIKELDLNIPKGTYDFVFTNFPLLISNAKNLNGRYSNSNNTLRFFWGNYIINIASASEVFIINEIFVENCYQFKLSNGNNKEIVVLDIGMNVGLASLYFSSIENVKKIYGFEPFYPTFIRAKDNYSLNPKLADKIKALNYGLGGYDQQLEVPYSSNNSGINSTLVQNGRPKSDLKSENIIIKDVYSQISDLITYHADSEFVLKIDTEGAEFEIFERLAKEYLWENISLIMLEWHFKSPTIIEEYLTANGFSLISTVLNKNAGLIYAFRTKK